MNNRVVHNQSNPHLEPSNVGGLYGKDGPPPYRFLTSIPQAARQDPYHHPSLDTPLRSSPRRNVIDIVPHSVSQRFEPRSPPCLTLDLHLQNHHNYSQLKPPKAAFVEPQSPIRSIHSIESISHSWNGDLTDPRLRSLQQKDEHSTPSYIKSSSPQFNLEHSSDWLSDQRQQKKRFRLMFGCLIIIISLLLVVMIIKIIALKQSHTPHASPTAATWANGGSGTSIPSFARNLTSSKPPSSETQSG